MLRDEPSQMTEANWACSVEKRRTAPPEIARGQPTESTALDAWNASA